MESLQSGSLFRARRDLTRPPAKQAVRGRSVGRSIGSLGGVATQFEHTLAATRAAKREHVGASADLDSVVSEISQQVRLLDGPVRYRFGGNAELMGAWASARNVAGPFRSHGAPAA